MSWIYNNIIQGYKQGKGFIIAQSPMATTVRDFVKMLYERECGVVVMLCGCEEGGVEVCAQYWPESADATMQLGELLVSTIKVTQSDGITQRLITITDFKVHYTIMHCDHRCSQVFPKALGMPP